MCIRDSFGFGAVLTAPVAQWLIAMRPENPAWAFLPLGIGYLVSAACNRQNAASLASRVFSADRKVELCRNQQPPRVGYRLTRRADDGGSSSLRFCCSSRSARSTPGACSALR